MIFVACYVFSGQKLNQTQVDALENLDENATWQETLMVKYRKLIGILIPFAFFQISWWCLAVRHDYFSYFPALNPVTNIPNYVLSITMIFGATVAGYLLTYIPT